MVGELVSWVLYENPSDFPGEWVVRRQLVAAGEVRSDPDLAARGATREECVKALLDRYPEVRALEWLPRHPTDDPVIDGSWM